MYNNSHCYAVAVGRIRNGDVFFVFPKLWRKILIKWIIKFLKRLNVGHLRFLDFKKLKLLKKDDARVYTTFK